jgi:hypothetical protein
VPSPFPGMDPFVEGQRWQDFHARFINDLADLLMPAVRPRYVVDVEQYVYLAREDEVPDRYLEPDLSIVEDPAEATTESRSSSAIATAFAPVDYTIPSPRRQRQRFLTIRDREFRDIVTVIELLSPTNKTPGDGFTEYLVKRSNIFHTMSNLVEIDLLRRGQRLPTREPLAPADFYAFICRTERLPKVEVYAWTLSDRLPAIPVPLATGEPDVPLDLQQAFTKTYDRSGYDYALEYRRAVEPPLDAARSDWVRTILGKANG